MDWRYLLISTYFSLITANSRHVNILDVQENERVRLQCTVTSTKDAEEVSMKCLFTNLIYFIRVGDVDAHSITT